MGGLVGSPKHGNQGDDEEECEGKHQVCAELPGEGDDRSCPDQAVCHWQTTSQHSQSKAVVRNRSNKNTTQTCTGRNNHEDKLWVFCYMSVKWTLYFVDIWYIKPNNKIWNGNSTGIKFCHILNTMW